MKPEIFTTEIRTTRTGQDNKSGMRDVVSIILLGLTPLVLLATIGVAVIVLIRLIQFLVDPVTFFLIQQLSFAIILLTGMTLAVLVYILAIRHALRQIRGWRQSGHTKKGEAGLVVVTLVASIILALPVFVMLFFY